MRDQPQRDRVEDRDRDGPLCRRLFWNGRLLDVEWDPAFGDPSADFVWCSHSMNCLGPDGRVASRRDCRRGRGCWER